MRNQIVVCEGNAKFQRAGCGVIGHGLSQSDAEMLAHAHGTSCGHKCVVMQGREIPPGWNV